MSRVDELFSSLSGMSMQRRPFTERELEDSVCKWLEQNRFIYKRQRSSDIGKTDLMIFLGGERAVLEIKRTATMECFPQLDRYSQMCDALAVVCWRATDPFRDVFRVANTKIPLALFELRKKAPMIT